MLSRALLVALAVVTLKPWAANAQAPERVVIVDLAVTDDSADAIGDLRERLTERSLSPANEPDVRIALERPVRDEDALAAAKTSLTTAKGHYADFSMGAVEGELLHAQAAALVSLARVADREAALATLAEIHFLWGRVRHADGKSDASSHFRAVARLDPSRVAIDRAKFKPALVELYRKAAASSKSGKGGLALTGRPTNAAISLNGTAVGTLPISVDDLSEGSHYVVIEASGFKTQMIVAEVGSSPVRLNVELEPLSRGERLAQQRQQLLSGDAGHGVLESLAQTAAATMVILVRESTSKTSGAGVIEVATFRVGKTLGPWGPPSMLTFRAAEAAGAAGAVAVQASETTMVAGASTSKPRPWYLTWKGAAAAGALVGIATVAVILLASGETEFEVGGACSQGACP